MAPCGAGGGADRCGAGENVEPSRGRTAGDAYTTPNESRAAALHIDGLNERLLLSYRDAGGNVTERWLTLRAADGHQQRSGTVHIATVNGYCHLRRMARTFRLDRIMSAADADGVVIDDLSARIMAIVKAQSRGCDAAGAALAARRPAKNQVALS
jgi:hypothetical protein